MNNLRYPSSRICEDGLVLHSDNGGPMKGATMLATLQMPGVVFSRKYQETSHNLPSRRLWLLPNSRTGHLAQLETAPKGRF